MDFLNTFLDEAVDILESWEAACMAIERSPSSVSVDALFRAAHNLKGSSRSVGLESFGAFVHEIENVITLLRSKQFETRSDLLALILECQTLLVEWVDGLRTDPHHVPAHDLLLTRLKLIQAPSPKIESEIQGFSIFEDEETKPLMSRAQDIGTILRQSGHVTQEQIETAISLQNRKLGEILVDQNVLSPEAVNSALAKQMKQTKSPKQVVDEMIRVSTHKLETMIRLTGEISIQHSIIVNACSTGTQNSRACEEAMVLCKRGLQDLHSEAMSLRMQTLDSLFQRMERVIWDVTRQLGKKVDFQLKGMDVELDKNVIEKMKDPLVHILRNSVDHGIEFGIDRLKAGKPETATIVLEGQQTASHVVIRITDDGRGLDIGKIRSKAIKNGLIQESDPLSPESIQSLIFEPGLSTAEKVTDVSGRGVGLDVVKKVVEELNGTIAVLSEAGRGTTFEISLPSSLSILDALIIGLGPTQYVVPIHDIDEVLDLVDVKVETATQKGRMINLRGSVIPITRLSEYLPTKATTQHQSLEESQRVALVTRSGQQQLAFEVDAILGQQAIVIGKLEGSLARAPGLSGSTVLPDGQPGIIISLPTLVKSYLRQVL